MTAMESSATLVSMCFSMSKLRITVDAMTSETRYGMSVILTLEIPMIVGGMPTHGR